MKNNEDITLGGFSALLDTLSGDGKSSDTYIDDGQNDDSIELDDMSNVDNNDYNADTEPPVAVDNIVDEPNVDDGSVQNADEDSDGAENIYALFDAISDAAGWGDVLEEEKPKTAEELVNFMANVSKENSKPKYYSEEIERLDEYLRNGGRLDNYLEIAKNGIDYDRLDLEDVDQMRAVVAEFLSEKGFDDSVISRKLDKYEEAGILEDEASDAIESLKTIKEERKKALLEGQKNEYEEAMIRQQNYRDDVVKNIEDIKDIRGIKIPAEDKAKLVNYIFNVEADGMTKFQKDYAKSTRNLIESAYFTMKGGSIIEKAKQSGEATAIERLKKTLSSEKIVGSRQRVDSGESKPIWEMASRQLLRKPL